jgi:hypothetical protein
MRRGLLASRLQAWLIGIGSVLDLSGNVDDLLDREQSDWVNLRSDWQAVGRDVERALDQAEGARREAESRQLSLAL